MDIYKKLAEATGFEWDKGNSFKNPNKHCVTNAETEETFFNFNLVNFDEKHSAIENRYYLLGQTNQKKILFIVFVLRSAKIRVISSRTASKKERQVYSEHLRKYEKF